MYSRVPGETAAEAALQLDAGGVVVRVSVRSDVHVAGRVRTRTGDRAGKHVFGRNSCNWCVPLFALIGEREDNRRRQVLLNRCLPVVQVADVEIRIDGVGLRRCGDGRRQESVGQRKRIRQRIRLRHAIGERRLLRHLIRQRLIDGRVVVKSVTGAHHCGTLSKRPPCDADARLKFTVIRTNERIGITSLARQGASGGGGGADRRLGGEVRADIQIHQTVVEFVHGRLEIPAQTEIETQVAACMRQSSLTNPSTQEARKYLSALP